MKFSAVIALSIAALASAQVPKGTGTDAPKVPEGVKCTATCLAPIKEAGCKFETLLPKGAGGGAGSMMAGKPPGSLAKPGMVRRQTDSPAKSPPKISPETIAAAKSARNCFCNAPQLKAAQACITTSCASAPDGGASGVKGINAICKGIAAFTPLTPAAGAAPKGTRL